MKKLSGIIAPLALGAVVCGMLKADDSRRRRHRRERQILANQRRISSGGWNIRRRSLQGSGEQRGTGGLSRRETF